MQVEQIVAGLNAKQREAVCAPAKGRLQIIAGPGTGKTKVLISRVAYLLLKQGIDPQHIIVTTFTKKAANEMVERLEQLLGGSGVDVSKLLIGTFHSLCYRIVKIYGKRIGVEGYVVADERDSSQVLKEAVSGLTGQELDYISGLRPDEVDPLSERDSLDVKKIKQRISSLKSAGVSTSEYSGPQANRCLALIYAKYQQRLQDEQLMDFDDCLLYCYKLIANHPVLNFIEHVLVDEFQDTNEIQLRLMYRFAGTNNNVSVVGDPDQSIYAFRDAQAVNFDKMKAHYRDCTTVTLDENYRSTAGILQVSERVMRQQNNRAAKTLTSQFTPTFRPVYHNLTSPEQEARWVCYQIEHLAALPSSPVGYSDMAILVRTAYQTRVIESELVKKRIPYFMVRGKAFWDRKEVGAIMSYLRAAATDSDRLAVVRTINMPKRGIGDKTLAAIDARLAAAAARNQPMCSALSQICGEQAIKLQAKTRLAIMQYVEFLQACHEKIAILDTSNKDELAQLFTLIYSGSGLAKEYANDTEANLNINEVKSQFCQFVEPVEDLPLFNGGTPQDKAIDDRNFVAKFVHSVGLYETDTKTDEQQHGKVAISTIHGSKGLEWPVVFVPGLSENLLPAKFALDSGSDDAVNEERRCFYVATTRAKYLLYLSSYTESDNTPGSWGRKIVVSVSRFIDKLSKTNMLADTQDALNSVDNLQTLYSMLGKKWDEKLKLNLDSYFKLYKSRLLPYIRGETMRITLENPDLGFTSATEIKKRQGAGLSANKGTFKAPRLGQTPEQPSQVKTPKDITAFFGQSPKLAANHTPPKPRRVGLARPAMPSNPGARPALSATRAPAYNRDPTQLVNKSGQKAPPYIPDRTKK